MNDRSKITPQPDWEGFARAIMGEWPENGDVDGFHIQDLAQKHHLLVEVPGGFDPNQHSDPYHVAEKGDPWFMLNYEACYD